MCMLFVNVDREDVKFYVNNRGWRRIFRLARMFNWTPQGTQPYINGSVKGYWNPNDYFSNECQLVCRADAFELADSIEWAITMLKEPDPEDDPEKQYGSDWEKEMISRMENAMRSRIKDPAYIFFNIKSRVKLNEFVDFCRHGEFVIY